MSDAIKKTFREGRHAQAIADCEALCAKRPADRELKRLCATMHAMTRNFARAMELLLQVRDPAREDPDILFNIALCARELKDFTAADTWFGLYAEKFPSHPEGWASLAECKFQRKALDEGIRCADRAIALDAACEPAWAVRGHCQKAAGRFAEALASYTRALQLAPNLAPLHVARGDTHEALSQRAQAAADYRQALALAPGDGDTLKKATLLLLESGQGLEAIQLCREVLKRQPDNITAKLGAEWLLSQLVPLWHVPMMNEPQRNQAYLDGLRAAVTPGGTVFEIGAGSGLLAMMAARLGAQRVVSCEAVPLIADTASKIVKRNGLQDRVTVLAKPSQAVQLGADLPARADILLHEVFSSELLGEHVLPAIEDAKARLLKPGGTVLPAAASIMIALVGGEDLGKNVHVGESFGFDLSEFNAISPRKRPLYREDLAPELLSAPVEAFRFDFQNSDSFPPEKKRIAITATAAGRCYGLIQWIRIEMGAGIVFENHPGKRKMVSNWQQTVYGFERVVDVEEGAAVMVEATHDRARPWFEKG